MTFLKLLTLLRAEGVEPTNPFGYKDLKIPGIPHTVLLTQIIRVDKSEIGRKYHSSELIFTGFSPEKHSLDLQLLLNNLLVDYWLIWDIRTTKPSVRLSRGYRCLPYRIYFFEIFLTHKRIILTLPEYMQCQDQVCQAENFNLSYFINQGFFRKR
jgi:hypothetical protein